MFHRLAIPSYFGGLPGGYDYINNALSGTPALADGQKAGGPNAGTYFVAFNEDARGFAANRPIAALAENCDYLDNLLHRDLALPTRTGNLTVAGPAMTARILPGPDIYLGGAGFFDTQETRDTLFQVLDSNDREIVGDDGVTECKVTAVSGGSIGGGFSVGNVTVTITPGVPTGVSYHVNYSIRGNLATLPTDAFINVLIKGAQEVPAELIGAGGASLVGYAGGPNWFNGVTNPAATVEAQLDKIVADLVVNSNPTTNNGARKIGSAETQGTWADGGPVGAASVWEQLNVIVGTLGETGSGEGTALIGDSGHGATFTDAPYTVTPDPLYNQLAKLIGFHNDPYRTRIVSSAAANLTLDGAGYRDALVVFAVQGSGKTFTLPPPASHPGRRVYFINLVTPTPTWSIVTSPAAIFVRGLGSLQSSFSTAGPGSAKLGQWVFHSDGTRWHVVSSADDMFVPGTAGTGSALSAPYGLNDGTLLSHLASLMGDLNQHALASGDHDYRYYTQAVIDATFAPIGAVYAHNHNGHHPYIRVLGDNGLSIAAGASLYVTGGNDDVQGYSATPGDSGGFFTCNFFTHRVRDSGDAFQQWFGTGSVVHGKLQISQYALNGPSGIVPGAINIVNNYSSTLIVEWRGMAY